MPLTKASPFQVHLYHKISWSVVLFLLATVVDIVPGRTSFKNQREEHVFSEAPPIRHHGNLIDKSFGTYRIESQLIKMNKTDSNM